MQWKLAAARRTLGKAGRSLGLCDAHSGQFRSARHQEHLQRRRSGRSGLRRVPGPELSGAAAVRRSRPCRGAGFFARRLAGSDVGRTRRHRASLAKQIPCRRRFLSTLPWIQRQHDRSHPDPDRRTRRLDPGAGVPQHGGRPRRLRNIPAQGPKALRCSSSSIPTPIMPSTCPAFRRPFNISGITSNSTSRRRSCRSTNFANFSTPRLVETIRPRNRRT